MINQHAHVTPLDLHLDTFCILADQSMFYLVWRGVHLINDISAHEVATVQIS